MTSVTYVCDMCNRKFDKKYDIRTIELPTFIKEKAFDGWEMADRECLSKRQIDLCGSCFADAVRLFDKTFPRP